MEGGATYGWRFGRELGADPAEEIRDARERAEAGGGEAVPLGDEELPGERLGDAAEEKGEAKQRQREDVRDEPAGPRSVVLGQQPVGDEGGKGSSEDQSGDDAHVPVGGYDAHHGHQRHETQETAYDDRQRLHDALGQGEYRALPHGTARLRLRRSVVATGARGRWRMAGWYSPALPFERLIRCDFRARIEQALRAAEDFLPFRLVMPLDAEDDALSRLLEGHLGHADGQRILEGPRQVEPERVPPRRMAAEDTRHLVTRHSRRPAHRYLHPTQLFPRELGIRLLPNGLSYTFDTRAAEEERALPFAGRYPCAELSHTLRDDHIRGRSGRSESAGRRC